MWECITLWLQVIEKMPKPFWVNRRVGYVTDTHTKRD